jgi:hypothetical protein
MSSSIAHLMTLYQINIVSKAYGSPIRTTARQPGTSLRFANRACLLGKICDAAVQLFDAGSIADLEPFNLTIRCEDVSIDRFVVTPNHVLG